MSMQEAASEAVRLATIQVLGFIAVLTGLLIALTAPDTGATWAMVKGFWWWPEAYGLVLVATGLVQVYGVRASRPRIAAVACFGSMLWYIMFAGVFGLTYSLWAMHGMLGNDEPSVYPTVVYLGLASLHCIQGMTVLTKNTADRLEKGD